MTEHSSRRRPGRPRTALPLDGSKLRRRRIVQGLTLQQAAEKAQITKGHLSMIETGRRGGTPPVLLRLARVLDCSVESLMPDTPQQAAV
jgi:transcriptional regulator with XRE-family HTH domain